MNDENKAHLQSGSASTQQEEADGDERFGRDHEVKPDYVEGNLFIQYGTSPWANGSGTLQ